MFIGLAGAYFGYDYVSLKKALPDLKRLQRENLDQQAQILAFAEKIEGLKGEMEDLSQFNKKIKTAINPDRSGQETHFKGQGGPLTEESTPLAALAVKRRELARRMQEDLYNLDEEASLAEQAQQELHARLESRKSVLAATPSILPAQGWVTSGFGYRRSPFTGRREFHRGIDIANRVGSPIKAPAAGIVAKVAREGGYGRMVIIHHGYGLVTHYAHLHRTKVKPGEMVKRGQVFATMGNSGRSTGSHLHYEVRLHGKPVNPSRYIID